MTLIKVATLMCDEMLDQANNSAEPVVTLKNFIKDNKFFPMVLDACVNDHFPDFDLEDVKVRYNLTLHRSVPMAYLLSRPTISTYTDVILNPKNVKSTKMAQTRNLAELLYVGEAKIFIIGMLQKNLPSLYPNLTHEVVCQALS